MSFKEEEMDAGSDASDERPYAEASSHTDTATRCPFASPGRCHRRKQTASTLVVDSQPPGVCRNKALLLKPQKPVVLC